MRKAFAKRLAAVLLALCVAAALPFASAFAAEKTFVVTFSGGEHGTISAAEVKKLTDAGYTVKTKPETGDEFTLVAVQLSAGAKLPAVPAINVNNSKYDVLNNGSTVGQNATDAQGAYLAGADALRNYELVPEFFITSDTDVTYTLRYVLNGAEDVEVSPAQIGRAPYTTFAGGEGLLEAAPENVAEFTLDVNATLAADSRISYADGVFTLKDDSAVKGDTLEFTFYYTQNVHVNTVTEYVDGDVVVNYNDVNLVGGAGVVGGGDGGAGAGDGGEEIPDEETPQAGGEDIPDESTPQAGGEDIPDESTPQAGGESTPAGVSMPMVVGGVVGLLAILLIVLVALRKRKGGQEE